MKKNRLARKVAIKVALTLSAAIILAYALIVGDEIVLPSALLLFILLLGTFRKIENQQSVHEQQSKSFRYAVVTFSIFFAVTNIFLSLFFPSIAQSLAIDGLYDGEFVRVTINDAHEFCYSICLLLLIEIAFYYGLRRKNAVKLSVQK